MPRKMLTLDDLYDFYANKNKSIHFSAKNDGDRIVVSVPGMLNFDESNKDTEGLTPVTLQACHILKNDNGSYISKENMEKALPSFSNRPILGYIYQDDNGDYQFRDHARHINDDGEVVYDESPIGIIPESCNAHLEYDEDKDKTYVVVDGYIFEEYSKAREILDREEECSVSVELSIRELSYNAKNKYLDIEDFYFSGVTVLGKWESGDDVLPGMRGSNIRISDFKQRNNTTFSQNNVIAMLNEINDKINQLSINIQGKEEPNMVEFEENVEVTETSENEEVVVEEATTNEEDVVEEATTEESNEEVTVTEAQSEEPAEVTPSEEKFTKVFEISHEDIRYALYNLLAEYEANDNDWYGITAVYDDYFVYEGWFNAENKYRQGYKKDGDNISFDGERIHMNVEYLTDSELVALNEMRSNYSAMQDELSKFHAEPEKMEILCSEDYSAIADSEEFAELKKQEGHFDLSVEEVKSKADEMLLAYAKQHGVDSFAKTTEESKTQSKPIIPIAAAKRSRYGGIFSK